MSRETANQLSADIARQIVNHLRQSGAKRGDRLTERKLAKAFDVSRSPVRLALNMLSDEGVLETRNNGGRYLAVDQRDLEEHARASSHNPVVELYDNISNDRIANDFPENVTEADLMRRYGATRGLLLKVLNQMASEGLMERRKGHGWRCLPIINSPESYYSSYQFRQTIEPALLLADSFEIDEARLARCYDKHKELVAGLLFEMPPGEVYEVNADFHQMLADFSCNAFFQEAIHKQNQLRLIVEKRAAKHSGRMQESCREHMDIMDAIRNGDRKAASELMSYHLTKASRSFLGLTLDHSTT